MSHPFMHHTPAPHTGRPRTPSSQPAPGAPRFQEHAPRCAADESENTSHGTEQTTLTSADAEDAAMAEQAQQHGEDLRGMVEQPTKVMRIGTMIKQLLEEVRAAPLDEAGRYRLKEIHRQSVTELEQGLSGELTAELDRLSLPFTQEETPSEPELRIAQAQLVGWLEGLFHGLQTAIYAQQMASRAQLQEIRRELPGGQSDESESNPRGTGQYL